MRAGRTIRPLDSLENEPSGFVIVVAGMGKGGRQRHGTISLMLKIAPQPCSVKCTIAHVAHELFRCVEPTDLADRSRHGEGYDHVHARNCHRPFDAVIGKCRAREIALDDLEVLGYTL